MPPAVPGTWGPASRPAVWPACAVVCLPRRPLRQAGPEATLTSLTPATSPRPTRLARAGRHSRGVSRRPRRFVGAAGEGTTFRSRSSSLVGPGDASGRFASPERQREFEFTALPVPRHCLSKSCGSSGVCCSGPPCTFEGAATPSGEGSPGAVGAAGVPPAAGGAHAVTPLPGAGVAAAAVQPCPAVRGGALGLPLVCRWLPSAQSPRADAVTPPGGLAPRRQDICPHWSQTRRLWARPHTSSQAARVRGGEVPAQCGRGRASLLIR